MAITGIFTSEYCLIKSFKSFKSFAFLTNDKAIQSTCCEIAKIASSLSLLVRAGSEIYVFGKFTPLFDLITPSIKALACTIFFWLVLVISKINLPSSINIFSPTFTSLAKFE